MIPPMANQGSVVDSAARRTSERPASSGSANDLVGLEKTGPTYQNVVAIRTADKDKPWVKDLADAYRSREFLAVTDAKFAGFVKTDYQQALAVSLAK